jgi:hypothetical protein
MTQPHIWKGETISTIGELFRAAAALVDEEEGAEFMRQYIAVLATSDDPEVAANPVRVASSNVGYIAGYGDPDTMKRIHRYTKAVHPVFGSFS